MVHFNIIFNFITISVHTKAVGRLLEDYGVYSYNRIVRMSSLISVPTPALPRTTEYFALA